VKYKNDIESFKFELYRMSSSFYVYACFISDFLLEFLATQAFLPPYILEIIIGMFGKLTHPTRDGVQSHHEPREMTTGAS